MKKLALILIGLLFSYISFAQEEKREMSNYEKYLLQKEQIASQDTIFKTDTVLVGEEKKEWDDLYYTPSKDQLKLKSKELRLRKREIRMEQDSMYYDAKKEVYEDLSFTANIYRFHRPYYGFGYYNYYWDPFYDPWFVDSWYYGYSPFWGWNYPYYRSSWYFGFGWGYPYHYPYYHYPSYRFDNHYGYNRYNMHNNNNSIAYGRRDRPSNLSSNTATRRQPVTINRTVQIDRNTGRTLSVSQENRRVVANRPANNQTRTQNRSYTPSYETPRLGTRPLYNNTNTNRVNSTERRMVQSQPSTQSRSSYSTPRTSTNRSSTYSTPSRSNSSPSRSYNSGSSNFNSSRSSGSSYSAPSRSSSGSSFSGGSSGSSSGGSSRSSSSGSSSGRR